jgi:hypothetical protein
MSSLRQSVASVLRLAAVGLILLGLAVLAMAWAATRQADPSLLTWVLGGLSLIGGSVLLVASSPLARALTQDYE